MKPFEKIMKRPTLPNYYRQRHFQWPDTLPEIFDYLRQHDELPFLYGGDNWPYDAMCERQRRQGVFASQFLTPRPHGAPNGGAGRAVVRQREPYRGRLLWHGAAHAGVNRRRSAYLIDCRVRCRYGHGSYLRTALSRGDRDAESVSEDRFPLRERHRQPAVRGGGVYGVPAVAG